MTARTGEPLVVLDSVNKHFGPLHVLRDVCLTVNRGEVVVVVGPSRLGQVHAVPGVNRLEPIDSGTITFDGSPLPAEGRALALLRSEVGMVFQSFNLFAHRTILDNVMLGPVKVRKEGRTSARERAMGLLARGGIADQADKVSGPALRRPATAGRHRPCPGHAAEGDALRRTGQRARPRDGGAKCSTS